MRFLILFFLLFLTPIIYAQEYIEPSKEGTSIEVAEKQTILVGVVESSSLRIGNPREDSIEKYKMTIFDVKDASVLIKYKKFDNFTISLGQERKLDLDKDNIFDIGVLLLNLRSPKATLVFKSLEEKVPELEPSTTPVISETNNTIVQENTESAEEHELSLAEEQKAINKNYTIWILAALVSLLIIVGVICLIMKK